MFEHYTENAKQTVFFAKGEAARAGSPEVGTEHILLGLLRDESVIGGLMPGLSMAQIRQDIVAQTPSPREQSHAPLDLRLGAQGERALAFAEQEAQELGHRQIADSHILLGLLRVEGSYAAGVLRSFGLSLDELRSRIAVRYVEEDQRAVKAHVGTERPSQALKQLLLETTRQVSALCERGEQRRALQLLDDLIAEQVPDQSLRIRSLASLATVTALSIGDTNLARHYCEIRLTENPDNPMALYAMAECLVQGGDSEEAKSYAARCFKLSAARQDTIGDGVIELLRKRFPDLGPSLTAADR